MALVLDAEDLEESLWGELAPTTPLQPLAGILSQLDLFAEQFAAIQLYLLQVGLSGSLLALQRGDAGELWGEAISTTPKA